MVCGLQTDETLAYMRGKGAFIADKPLEVVKNGLNGHTFIYGGYGFFTQMVGAAQPYNAATAIEAARLLKISDGAIYSGSKPLNSTADLKFCGRTVTLIF